VAGGLGRLGALINTVTVLTSWPVPSRQGQFMYVVTVETSRRDAGRQGTLTYVDTVEAWRMCVYVCISYFYSCVSSWRGNTNNIYIYIILAPEDLLRGYRGNHHHLCPLYIIYAFVRLISIDATVRMISSTVVSYHLMAYGGTLTFSLVMSPTIWWVSVELHRGSVTGLAFVKYTGHYYIFKTCLQLFKFQK
jgi:hypothetical protein